MTSPNDTATDDGDVQAWMKSLGFDLAFDTGRKSYYNQKMQRVINAEAATFFHTATEAARADERQKILERLNANGHGGGNWRRLIQVELDALGSHKPNIEESPVVIEPAAYNEARAYEAARLSIIDGASEGELGVDWSVTDVMVAAIRLPPPPRGYQNVLSRSYRRQN